MKSWEELLFDNEEEALEYYRQPLLPKKFSVALFWVGAQDFRNAMFRRTNVKPGGKLLLVSEDNVRCKLTDGARALVGEKGELADIDVMSTARSITPSYWDIYTKVCAPYEDGYFDAAVATTSHHMEDADTEMRELARVVRTGGRVIYADNGPGRAFYEAAKQDAHLEVMAQIFATWMGVRFGYGETLDESYENLRAWGSRFYPEEIAARARSFLNDVETFEWKGLWLVAGTKE